jgi:hypothetical protein
LFFLKTYPIAQHMTASPTMSQTDPNYSFLRWKSHGYILATDRCRTVSFTDPPCQKQLVSLKGSLTIPALACGERGGRGPSRRLPKIRASSTTSASWCYRANHGARPLHWPSCRYPYALHDPRALFQRSPVSPGPDHHRPDQAAIMHG